MRAPTITYGCTTCGRTTGDAKDWVIRGPEVVVQGVHLGTCGSCFGRDTAKAATCDGTCDGMYRSSAGTYYIAEFHDGFGWERGWSCWEKTCVEGWDPDDGLDCECPHCYGDHYDVRVITVVDGERQKARR